MRAHAQPLPVDLSMLRPQAMSLLEYVTRFARRYEVSALVGKSVWVLWCSQEHREQRKLRTK